MAITGGKTQEGLMYLAKLQLGLIATIPTSFKFILASGAVWNSATSKSDFIKTEIDEANGYSRYDLSVLDAELIYNSVQKRIELTSPKRWNVTASGLALQWNGFAVLVNAHSQGNALLESVNAATDTFTLTGHGLTDDDEIIITADLGATLPTGVSNSIYYVVNSAANTFQISTSQGGSTVDFSDNGSGNLRLRYANGLVLEAYYNDQEQTILDSATHSFDWYFNLFNSVQTMGNSW